MKSTEEDLRKRGAASQCDLDHMTDATKEQLFSYIKAEEPSTRTAAIRTLSERLGYDSIELAEILLQRLTIEKSLYTKLEICQTLEQGNINTTKLMIPFLGHIGNNQYTDLPKAVSKKKSYPLPRDIIARSLGRMTSDILPLLFDVLQEKDRVKISEAVDAIGFFMYHHSKNATSDHISPIRMVMQRFQNDYLILWKCILCLSSFPLKESMDILYEVLNQPYPQILLAEANRSLHLIQKHILPDI